MRVICFDCEHEKDLEYEVNEFLSHLKDEMIIDIQYQTAMTYDERNQVFSYSCMIIYDQEKATDLKYPKKGRYKSFFG